MATKKKKAIRRRHQPVQNEAISERIRSLDDAVFAALDSITDQAGAYSASEIVSRVLVTIAAKLVWHDTAATEEEFADKASQCFQLIAEAHANCKRGEPAQHAHTARHEDLN
jgi:cell division protein ZapA (FtsZ GTPase activity inhibitor)